MQRLYKRASIVYFVFLLFLATAAFVLKRTGYSLSIPTQIVWSIITAVAVAVLAAVSYIKRKDTTNAAGIIAQFLPLLTVVNFFFIDYIFTDLNNAPLLLFDLYLLILSFLVSFVSKSPRIFRIICRVFNSILLVACMCLIMLWLPFAGMLQHNVFRRVPSPDSSYTAVLGEYNQGALGGSLWVNIEYHHAEINFGLGRLKKVEFLHSDENWRPHESVDMEWEDDHTLLIDGVPYHVE